ncbi:hypothetical protein BJX63DRAFT_438834 [Aspergillus granulosus]|uniref:Uncharacterized protein n=1 Tax=Aspergillus granulosus TaxID=176169 RepID=A0ABR4GQZ6_9EURO
MEIQQLLGQPYSRLGMGDDAELHSSKHKGTSAAKFKEIGREWDKAAGLRNPKDVIAARTRSSKKDAVENDSPSKGKGTD